MYQEKEVEPQQIRQYLDKMNLEKPSEEILQILNVPITDEELKKAITDLKTGKAPGPDGFSSKYYKIIDRTVRIPYRINEQDN